MRNTYSVAMMVGGGRVPRVACFRPQPWAGETQLLQRCCCLWKPLSNSPQGARMLTWCGSHSGCVGGMEHESRRILNLRRCSIYLIIYVFLCMGGGIYGVSL